MSFFGNNSLLARRKSVAGSGTWNVDANGNWSTPSNWLNGVVPNGADQFADFSKVNLTNSRTVTVDGNYTIGELTAGDLDVSNGTLSLYTFSGGSLTFSNSLGPANINLSLGGSTAQRRIILDTALAGNNRLVFTQSNAGSGGFGVVQLRGIQTFTGNLTIGQGTYATPFYLDIGGDANNGLPAQLGSGNYAGNIDIQGANRFRFLSTLDNNLSGVISGGTLSALVLFSGNGTTTLSNSNTFSGTIECASALVQPRLRLGHENAAQSARLAIQANNVLLFSPGIGTFNIGRGMTGTGNFVLTDSNNVGVTLSIGASNPALSDTYIGQISGLGGVTKVGSAYFLSLTGANTYTGTTSILSGTLRVSGAAINSATASKVTRADFTNTTLTVTFATAPAAGETYRLFPGSTVQSYSTVTLSGTGVTGRTATYNSANSTLTILPPNPTPTATSTHAPTPTTTPPTPTTTTPAPTTTPPTPTTTTPAPTTTPPTPTTTTPAPTTTPPTNTSTANTLSFFMNKEPDFLNQLRRPWKINKN